MFDETGIYSPGPIKPVVKVKENIAVYTQNAWDFFSVDFIEGMPLSAPSIIDLVTVAGVAGMAANGTLAKRIVPALQLNEGEMLHLRWFPLDNVVGTLWERSAQARFNSRGILARCEPMTRTFDPYLATTTFWVLGQNRDINLQADNPMGYAIPAARFGFFGYRYTLTSLLTPQMSADMRKRLMSGDVEAVRQSGLGPFTWLPAEGR